MGPSKTINQKKRFGDCKECIVCGGKTISAHLGMDMCRACSVFYRRSVGKRVYECRSNTNKCDVRKGALCRKCRFERIEKLLANTENIKDSGSLLADSSPVDCMDLAGDSDHIHRCEPSGSNAVPSLTILDRVRASYRTMSQIRLTSELTTRAEPPHPMLMNEEDCPFAQATLGSINTCNRILLSTIVGFGKSSFPEYASMTREQQWSIAVNFMYRFGIFEASYRGEKIFPNDPERILVGYTYWFAHNFDAHFLKDCPNKVDAEHLKTSMNKNCKSTHTNFRVTMKRLKLAEPEFLYIASLLFWSTEGLELGEGVASIAERNKAAIMQELHVYFREEQRMENYAERLGELLAAIHVFDKIDNMKKNHEFLRLMNVFSDDSFLYQLQRECAH